MGPSGEQGTQGPVSGGASSLAEGNPAGRTEGVCSLTEVREATPRYFQGLRMLFFLALILWLQITFLRFKNVKFISDSVKTWQLSLIFSRNVDGCGTMLSNKQDFSCGDFVAADGYSKVQMVTGLKPTRYPLSSTWESGNSWPGNDLFPEQLSLDNWMCVCERETEREREGERKNMCVGAWVNM